MPTPHPISADYAAQLDDVLEITLLGVADAGFWRRHLAPLGLSLPPGEAAAVRLSAAAAHFRGLPFREVSVSVTVAPPPGAPALPNHAYLLRAINSNWLFAFIERTAFATPYDFARCTIGADPARILVAHGGSSLLDVARDMAYARPSRTEPGVWRGGVWLPPRRAGAVATRYFIAEIEGTATVSPFVPGKDRCRIAARDGLPFAPLAASGFEPREWIVRHVARHAKSKTHRRSVG